MNKIKEFFRDWSIFEKVWLIFVCSLMTVIWFINGDTPFMLVLSLTGSLNLVLGAKGKVAGLYFAIINSAMYAYQCLGIPLYGEVMYNVLYSIPVSATAIYLWKKNATSDGEVRFRTMTLKLVAGVSHSHSRGSMGIFRIVKIHGRFLCIHGFTDHSGLRYSQYALSAALFRAVAYVGYCKCPVHYHVDYGVCIRGHHGPAYHCNENSESAEFPLRIHELEKNIAENSGMNPFLSPIS